MVKQASVWLFPISVILLAVVLLMPGLFSKHGVVEMDRVVETPLFDGLNKKNLFVFFGYVGCREVCSPRLEAMASVYDTLSPQQQAETTVLFIDIRPGEDREQSQLFSRSFHPAFTGVALEKETLQHLMRMFDARSSPSLLKKGEFDHTAFIYLLKRETSQYRIKAIFTQLPLDRANIAVYL